MTRYSIINDHESHTRMNINAAGDWLLYSQVAVEIEALEEERNKLRVRVEELNKHFADAANERDELRRRNAALASALRKVVSWYDSKDCIDVLIDIEKEVKEALAAQPEGGEMTELELNQVIVGLEAQLDDLRRQIDRDRESVSWADETRILLAKELGVIAKADRVVSAVQELRRQNAALVEALRHTRAILEKHNSSTTKRDCAWYFGETFAVIDEALAAQPKEAK